MFLISLFTGLITGYIFKKCKDEIAYLAGIVAVVSLIVSLVLAPWEIQFLLLVCVLIITQKLLQKNEYKLKLEEHGQGKLNYSDHNEEILSQPKITEEEITRKYRGASYQAENSAEFIEGEVAGKYRGLPWRIHQITTTPQLRDR
jgi:membrane protein implicated in regulation of membrane protease activity